MGKLYFRRLFVLSNLRLEALVHLCQICQNIVIFYGFIEENSLVLIV